MYKLEEIINHFDLTEVRKAVQGEIEGGLVLFEVQPCFDMVWVAIEKWLARDAYVFDIQATEEHFTTFKHLAHGITDLRGIIKRPFKTIEEQYVGKQFVLDWKTSRSTLDKTWQDRLEGSWQWKLYAAHWDTGLIFYRGVNPRGETREFILEPPEDVYYSAEQQFRQIKESRDNYLVKDIFPWARNMPFACTAYGRDCEYIPTCHSEEYPRNTKELIKEIQSPLSYSSMQRFMLCPEKHRRYLLDQAGADLQGNTEETSKGRAVHRGLEVVYNQLMELQKANVID